MGAGSERFLAGFSAKGPNKSDPLAFPAGYCTINNQQGIFSTTMMRLTRLSPQAE